MIGNPPKIENAPGLTWRPRKHAWEARWQCRTDLSEKGYRPKSAQIWVGVEPNETEVHHIQQMCHLHQKEMLMWGRGGVPVIPEGFTGTLNSLIRNYKTDPDSTYHNLRHGSRKHYDVLLKKISFERGHELVQNMNARMFKAWHKEWSAGGKITAGHHYMTMIRILMNFGGVILEHPECARCAALLHGLKFPMAPPREVHLTSEQVNSIREKAHEEGRPSIALAQAFQFECMLRQKDVIGEYVPISDIEKTDVIVGNKKWLRGIQWQEIDGNLTLRHVTSKRSKKLEVPLSRAPMVMEELAKQFPDFATAGRAALPERGPIVVSEFHRVPWESREFYRWWRILADKAGVPKGVRNMDSRAGAITEATEAGAELEHVKHAATHGDIAMTQRYSRGAADKVAKVLDIRTAHRNKTGK